MFSAKRFCTFFSFWILVGASCALINAQEVDANDDSFIRARSIEFELDEASKKMKVVKDTAYEPGKLDRGDSDMEPQKGVKEVDPQLIPQSHTSDLDEMYERHQDEHAKPSYAKEEGFSKNFFYEFFNTNNPLREFEVGLEEYFFVYREPTLSVKDSGFFTSVFADYTFRLSEHPKVHHWRDVIDLGRKINMFRLDGRFAYGQVEYDGSLKWDDIDNYLAEVRGLVGTDLPLAKFNIRLTPYVGVGYRYLYDHFSSLPAQTVGGVNYYSGYDRESKYVYLPIGFDAVVLEKNGWQLSFNFEFDFFADGQQETHLEDMHDSNNVSLGYDKLSNNQDDGYGLRSSIKVVKETSRFRFFVEPFIRYWNIGESDPDLITIQGAVVAVPGQQGYYEAGYEPENETYEFGCKAGIQF